MVRPGTVRLPSLRGALAALAASSLVLALAGRGARAEGDAAPPAGAVDLSWRLAAGQSRLYRIVTDQTAKQAFDEHELETRQKQTLDLRLTVQEVRQDGTARLTCRYERVAIELDQMLLGRMRWDSADPDAVKRHAEPLVAPFAALVGGSFSFLLAPDGTVPAGGLQGFDKIRAAVLGPVQELQFANAVLAPAYSDDAVRAMLERSFGLFPGKSVAPGARWARRVTQPLAMLGPLLYDHAFELLEVKDGSARVGFSLALSAAPQPKDEREPANADEAVSVTLEEGAGGKGEAVYSVKDGWLTSSRIEAYMALRASIREPVAPQEGPAARRVRTEVRQVLTVESVE